MGRYMTLAVVAAFVVFLVESAVGQDSSATVRTYQGVSYKVADPSLEVFYTIGEPKEKKEEARFQPMLSVATAATASAGGGEQLAGGEGKKERLLRGHALVSEITVRSEGREVRIPWDNIRALRFARQPVSGSSLPPYIPHYRFSASVSLMDGTQVDADYVNLGGTILRGTTPNGRVDILWEDVEQVIFDR